MIITLQTLMFFRESLLNALDRLLRPYYKKFSLAFGAKGDVSEDEESDEQVFAEFDEERGVVFYPPTYLQRYAAVSDCLMDERWSGKLEKVVDLGFHDMSFIKYLKEVQGIKCILGVDIETIPLRCFSDLIGSDDYIPKRESPLEVTLFKGNAADPDYRLIGCDAVIAIEMIEHMLPHDLERLIHTVFGFIKPWIAIFTTPNGDFNVLFKALERNGLRRLDHFFEWSRDQFHDWCSNIVVRYPQYTVSCKGIGPGPPGTEHLGCCSQMAVFVAKEYSKQQDLNLNSLALVRDTPSPNSISNLITSWETIDIPNESKMIEPPKAIESYPELTNSSADLSCITMFMTSPSFTLDPIPYQDKTSQCNLKSEAEKGYMMFDYEQMYDIVTPRKKVVDNREYDIEDVCSRLNCTTLHVKKFSKTTQNLMAKNKSDTLVHTREVVDEIRHLAKLLNFNKDHNELENGTYTWCNINWGENAPYWNQYYKVVKEYIYPFETKSEESRILDLISDEINRLIDGQFEEDFSYELNKVEIPIEHLMRVVDHVTDDVDKVKDLLEWNGYEVIDNVVIHSRALVDFSSVGTQETDSQDTDTFSDWDSTDIHSTSMSEDGTLVPDTYARCLRRALDQKVRKLRTMLTADDDITTELDRVVCRLMKLALRTSKGRITPLPTGWMHCKLLDLLTLTEKAIERRKRHFIESYPLNAINEEKSKEMTALEKIKEDNTALDIVDKYKHLLNQPDERQKFPFVDLDFEDNLSASSADFGKDYDFVDRHSPSLIVPEATPDTTLFNSTFATQEEVKLERTLAWVEEDIEVVSYPDHNINVEKNLRVTNDYTTKVTKYYKKKFKPMRTKKSNDLNCVICKTSHSKSIKQNRTEDKSMQNVSKTNLVKKVSRKSSSNKSLGRRSSNKFVPVDNKRVRVKPRRKHYNSLHSTTSKPIPVSLRELCHPEWMIGNDMGSHNNFATCEPTNIDIDMVSNRQKAEVAATKHSQLIDIVTEDADETIALRRTFGTDADLDSIAFENETLIRSVSNTLMNDDSIFDKHNVSAENVDSKTIFLYDIDEPTTSKGIRHISMDVQCGPDHVVPTYSMLSATTSLTKLPKLFTAGIKIEDSTSDTSFKSTDCGTNTNDDGNTYTTIIPRIRSVGVKIKDPDTNIIKGRESSPIPAYNKEVCASTSLTQMPESFTAKMKTEEFITDVKMKSNDSGTCTNNTDITNKITVAKNRSICINTYDSDFNTLKEKEYFTNAHEYCDRSKVSSPQTTLLKSPCIFEIEDSLSELSVGVDSFAKKTSQHCDSLQIGNLQIIPAIDNKIHTSPEVSSKYAKPKLCNGGVQVHSYRDNQSSEDIMYQGEWQKNVPKVLTRRKVFNSANKKIINSNLKKGSSKENIKNKNLVNRDVKLEIKRSLLPPKRNPCMKHNSIKNEIQEHQKVQKEKKPFRNVLKVPSKLTMSVVSSKNPKSAFVLKNPPTVLNRSVTNNSKSLFRVKKVPQNLLVTKDDTKLQKNIKKSYVPQYLRQKPLKSTNDTNKNNLNLSIDSALLNKTSKSKKASKSNNILKKSKTEEIKNDLLRFQTHAAKPKYVIFRNEIEKNKSGTEGHEIIINSGGVQKRTSSKQRPLTPTSPNSSTCSSPCSIATVRAVTTRTKNTTDRRHSASSYISRPANSANSGSENIIPDRNRKSTKRCKSARTTDNKENIPQSSKQFNTSKKEKDIGKGTFTVRNNDVYLAHVKGSTPIQSAVSASSKHKTHLNIPKAVSPSLSRSSSLNFRNQPINNNEASETSQTSNSVLVIEPQGRALQSFTDIPKLDNVNHRLVTNWIDRSYKVSIENHTSKIMSDMRELIDETLDFIDDPFETGCIIDSDTVILSRENLNQRNDLNSSPASFKTVITTDGNCNDTLKEDIENALSRSFHTTLGDESIISLADTGLTVTDFDAFSFKSNTSSPKFSEYFADNEFSSSQKEVTPANSTSVREIYERKDQPFQPAQLQNTSRALAIQAFSGFSINGDHIPGDQPDPVNFIDSETGSFAMDVTRQATSEELLISGRSSDSFESCLLDEDSVVPNWLFQIISHQQSAMDELEAPDQLMIPLPIVEPMFDDNGNVLEEPRPGAGAGDGCGIHSDPSQDSSGQGTSVSSSDTSSGPQSEAILIDPSAFVAQFEMLRNAVESSVVVLAINDPEAVESAMTSRPVPIASDSQSFSRGEERRLPRTRVLTASDVDADVSSLETDVPDLSDN